MNRSIDITMVSNYINHHQMPFCEAICERDGVTFTFVQTQEMEQKRVDMGWYMDPHDISYVIASYEDRERAYKAIMDADILLIGWMEDETIVRDALERARKSASSIRKAGKGDKAVSHGQLIIRISERLYREGQWKAVSPRGLLRKYKDHIRYGNAPVYLLCNGAYVASDFALIGAYKDKMYKFGYFPRTRYYYDETDLWRNKPVLNRALIRHTEELPEKPPTLTDNEVRIIWAGRFMPLKHPEYMVRLATDLVKRGYRFHIDMIGSGEMEDELKHEAYLNMIEDYITFSGFVPPDKVRFLMERSHIHIFTSNHLEGWGAVVNEAMNGGCAEVVSAEAGAGPYLIRSEENGLLYENDSYDDMLRQVLKLMDEPELIERYGREAYRTIATLWNADVAAGRLMDFYEGYLSDNMISYEDGPFSKAEVIKPGFFKSGKLGE